VLKLMASAPSVYARRLPRQVGVTGFNLHLVAQQGTANRYE